MHTYMTTHTPRRRGTDVTKFVPGQRASCKVSQGNWTRPRKQARSRRPQLPLPWRPDKPVTLSSRLAAAPRKRRCFALTHTVSPPLLPLLVLLHHQKKIFGRSCDVATPYTDPHVWTGTGPTPANISCSLVTQMARQIFDCPVRPRRSSC